MRAVLLPRPKRSVQSSSHLDALGALALLMEFSCPCHCCECLTVVITSRYKRHFFFTESHLQNV